MNEQQNQALIRSLYEAFARGDAQTILNNLTDDVEWALEGPAMIPFAGARKGPREVMGFFEALATTQTGPRLTIDYFVAQGDKVASIGRYAGTVTATGKSFDSAVSHFFEIRDGKVASFVIFSDTAAMVEAYTQAAVG